MIFYIFLFCVLSCSGQDYSLERDEFSEESSELMNIVFNMSSKERPERLVNEVVNTTVISTTMYSTTVDVDSPSTAPVTPLSVPPPTRRVPSVCSQGEKNTEETNYPFSVSIQRKGAHYATGALIDKNWILSAAGAFYNVRESIKLFRALLGTVYCKRSGTLVPIKSIEVHPSYKYRKPSFDLALLQVASPVAFTSVIKPVALSTVRARVISAKFLTTYWPRLIVKGSVLPSSAQERVKYNNMRVSTQALVPRAACAAALRLLNEQLHNTSLCLKPILKYHTPCMPDVGAPVLAENGLWGITSDWAPTICPKEPVPTIFTRLSSPIVRTWIYSYI